LLEIKVGAVEKYLKQWGLKTVRRTKESMVTQPDENVGII